MLSTISLLCMALTLVHGDSCRDVTLNYCDMSSNLIDTITNTNEEVCKNFCSSIFQDECQFFAYDRLSSFCSLFSYSYDQFKGTCSLISGPEHPDISNCPDDNDECANVLEGGCSFGGSVLSQIPNIGSESLCQDSCQLMIGCQTFLYDRDRRSCTLLDNNARNCHFLYGTPDIPDLDQCPFGSLTTTTPVTTTTTTSRTSSSTTTTTTSTSTSTTTTTTASDSGITLIVTVFDALANQVISGVQVQWVSDSSSDSGVTNSMGQIIFSGPFHPSQVIQVSAESPGFESSIVDYVISESLTQYLSLSMSPELAANEEGRVVLNWNENPNDLDLHAVEIEPFGPSVFCEVSYLNKDCNFASLDADNSNGGDNGAETITLFQESLYVYTIFVQLYEDGISNTPLSQSGGRVAIFRKNQARLQVDVPTDDPNGDSHYWVVGCYDSRDKSFRILNFLATAVPNQASVCA